MKRSSLLIFIGVVAGIVSAAATDFGAPGLHVLAAVVAVVCILAGIVMKAKPD